MAVEVIETEKAKVKAAVMVNASADFVSLVKHGANRTPFKVLKEEKGGAERMNMIVQSVLTTKGLALEDVAQKGEEGWLSDITKDRLVENEDYVAYEQIPMEKFDSKTVSLHKIGDGVWAMAGTLKSDSEVSNPIQLGKSPKVTKAIGEVDMESLVRSEFQYTMENEVYAMMDVIYGSLRQTEAQANKRKSSILGAIDAFKSFMSMGLDAIGGTAMKIDNQNINKEVNGGDSTMFTFESKEQFESSVTGIVEKALGGLDEKVASAMATVMKKEDDAAAEKAAADKADAEKKEADAAASDLTVEKVGEMIKAVVFAVKEKSDSDLEEKINALAEKMDGLGDQLVSQPSGNVGDSTATDKKSDVFSGLLTKKSAAA